MCSDSYFENLHESRIQILIIIVDDIQIKINRIVVRIIELQILRLRIALKLKFVWDCDFVLMLRDTVMQIYTHNTGSILRDALVPYTSPLNVCGMCAQKSIICPLTTCFQKCNFHQIPNLIFQILFHAMPHNATLEMCRLIRKFNVERLL